MGRETNDTGKNGVLRMWIPYLGLIVIARDGEAAAQEAGQSRSADSGSYDPLPKKAQHQNQSTSHGDLRGTHAAARLSLGQVERGPINVSAGTPQEQGRAASCGNGEQQPVSHFSESETPVTHQVMPGFSGLPTDDSIVPQSMYPYVTAGADQWAFQGVDMAFFDSLMRETNSQSENASDNWWLSSVPSGS